MPQWTNWSGGVTCTPQRIATPASETKLIDLVRQTARTGATLRVTGSGHSFPPLCATDGVLVSLDGLQGLVEVNPAAGEATVWAGTKLHALGDTLWEHGLAQANMGDIDRQALAGAISTGTHGTGRTLGSISTQVAGLRLVTATGDVIDCSPAHEPEIFKAAQLSLGSLGVITQVTLRLLPAYYLHERTWVAPFDECLAQLDEHIHANRHFEFFWVPEYDLCAMKTLNPVELSPAEQDAVPLVNEPTTNDQPQGRLARYVRAERIDRSYRIFPSERTLKFNETEFAVPAPSGPACLCEIRQLMRTRYPHVVWPIEYRTLAADDLWLSPAYRRETVTISVHQAAELPYQPFFADVEAIFRNHHGRPHWGKIHTHRAPELAALYPQWAAFQSVRRRLDPAGLFLNDHLRTLLGT
jgi:FAD-linked oxidoreductase